MWDRKFRTGNCFWKMGGFSRACDISKTCSAGEKDCDFQNLRAPRLVSIPRDDHRNELVELAALTVKEQSMARILSCLGYTVRCSKRFRIVFDYPNELGRTINHTESRELIENAHWQYFVLNNNDLYITRQFADRDPLKAAAVWASYGTE